MSDKKFFDKVLQNEVTSKRDDFHFEHIKNLKKRYQNNHDFLSFEKTLKKHRSCSNFLSFEIASKKNVETPSIFQSSKLYHVHQVTTVFLLG